MHSDISARELDAGNRMEYIPPYRWARTDPQPESFPSGLDAGTEGVIKEASYLFLECFMITSTSLPLYLSTLWVCLSVGKDTSSTGVIKKESYLFLECFTSASTSLPLYLSTLWVCQKDSSSSTSQALKTLTNR